MDTNYTSRKFCIEKLQSMLYSGAANPSTGCKNCANVAPGVFAIEEDFGRARAYNQCGDPELVQQAIDSWYVYAYYSN